MPEKEYKVKWEIDISAGSAEEAAKLAKEIQLDENSIANVFEVTGILMKGLVYEPTETIDLDKTAGGDGKEIKTEIRGLSIPIRNGRCVESACLNRYDCALYFKSVKGKSDKVMPRLICDSAKKEVVIPDAKEEG